MKLLFTPTTFLATALSVSFVLLASADEKPKTDEHPCSCQHLLGSGVQLMADQEKQRKPESRQFQWGKGTKVLIVGGHASHDFDRWFNKEDTKTLQKDPPISVHYTDRPQDIIPALAHIDVLYLSQNQKMADEKTNLAIEAFANRGGGIVLVHAAIWSNWIKNWPNYYRDIVGGYSQGHDRYGLFDVKVVNKQHPVTQGFPDTFQIKDELYYHHVNPQGNKIKVLAQAYSKQKKTTYPTVWEVLHPKTKIICITLGHDGAAHQDEKYFQVLLRRAVKYVTPKKKP